MLSNSEKNNQNMFWTEWVDMRLDPDDYPAASGRYLTIVKKRNFLKQVEICYYNAKLGVFTIRQKAQDVIAWASLPPMPEDPEFVPFNIRGYRRDKEQC